MEENLRPSAWLPQPLWVHDRQQRMGIGTSHMYWNSLWEQTVCGKQAKNMQLGVIIIRCVALSRCGCSGQAHCRLDEAVKKP